MRQRINQSQLELLSPKARDRLLEWEQINFYTIDDYLEAPTIGWLIHFLSDRIPLDSHFELLREKAFDGGWGINAVNYGQLGYMELIDTLWNQVRLVLEGDEYE